MLTINKINVTDLSVTDLSRNTWSYFISVDKENLIALINSGAVKIGFYIYLFICILKQLLIKVEIWCNDDGNYDDNEAEGQFGRNKRKRKGDITISLQ
jgi:hypothetical protein